MSATIDPLKKERKEKKEKKEKRDRKDKDGNKKRKAAAISEVPSETTKTEEINQSPEPVTEPSSTPVVTEDSVSDNESISSETERPSKKRKASVDVLEVDLSLPEPPSKKALRRLKKGKPLPPSKSGAENTPEPEEKKPEVEKRSEYGVWIGNLPWSASKDHLRKFFTENSDITDDIITRIHMPGPNDGKSANKVEERKFGKKVENKGFAYVDFSTAEAVQQAIELSEQLLTGRRVLIKNAKSFEGRPERTKEEQRNDGKPPSKRVFLGNLTFDATEESIKDHFEKCGPIENVKLATFEDSGKCKGYGWIVFEELEAAEAAVKGFVRIEEPISDADDSEESEDDTDAEEGASKSKPKKKQTKTRKWWVNKIKGRPLRMEFAEDAQVRYKKRYGSGGTKNPVAGGADGEAGGEVRERPERPRFERPAKKVEYRQSYAPRLTGGIVESEGKKTTF